MDGLKDLHIGIILDGNRRWARTKGLKDTDGHIEGAKTFKEIAKYAQDIGLGYLTVYAFSTENWNRSKQEVSLLMRLFVEYLKDYSKKAKEDNIRVRVIGTREKLSDSLLKAIQNCEDLTKDCTGLSLNVCINYGSRYEITNAVKMIAREVKEGNLEIDNITEETISNHLYTKDIKDPDLVIRTIGELRLSNFLMWQNAYSEFLFIKKNWPDFKKEDLDLAIEEYKKRHRKFGAN